MTTDKTIKQMADDMNIDKQKLYRFIKKNQINESYQKNGVMHYDDITQEQVQNYFNSVTPSQQKKSSVEKPTNTTIVDIINKQLEILQNQLEIKDKQIDDLNKCLAEAYTMIGQVQQLHGADKILELHEVQEEKVILIAPAMSERKSKKKMLRFWK